jgi:hypothetical protein
MRYCTTVKRISNANKAKETATTDWGKEYWSKVIRDLQKSLN